MTVLHRAALTGQAEIVKILLDNWAFVDACTVVLSSSSSKLYSRIPLLFIPDSGLRKIFESI